MVYQYVECLVVLLLIWMNEDDHDINEAIGQLSIVGMSEQAGLWLSFIDKGILGYRVD